MFVSLHSQRRQLRFLSPCVELQLSLFSARKSASLPLPWKYYQPEPSLSGWALCVDRATLTGPICQGSLLSASLSVCHQLDPPSDSPSDITLPSSCLRSMGSSCGFCSSNVTQPKCLPAINFCLVTRSCGEAHCGQGTRHSSQAMDYTTIRTLRFRTPTTKSRPARTPRSVYSAKNKIRALKHHGAHAAQQLPEGCEKGSAIWHVPAQASVSPRLEHPHWPCGDL